VKKWWLLLQREGSPRYSPVISYLEIGDSCSFSEKEKEFFLSEEGGAGGESLLDKKRGLSLGTGGNKSPRKRSTDPFLPRREGLRETRRGEDLKGDSLSLPGRRAKLLLNVYVRGENHSYRGGNQRGDLFL